MPRPAPRHAPRHAPRPAPRPAPRFAVPLALAAALLTALSGCGSSSDNSEAPRGDADLERVVRTPGPVGTELPPDGLDLTEERPGPTSGPSGEPIPEAVPTTNAPFSPGPEGG